jgi:hypothetical protein
VKSREDILIYFAGEIRLESKGEYQQGLVRIDIGSMSIQQNLPRVEIARFAPFA